MTNLFVGCKSKNVTDVVDTKDIADKESEPSGVVEEQINPKIQEMETILMSQLEPMPKTDQGEKVGVLIISLTNPFWVNMKEKYERAGQSEGRTNGARKVFENTEGIKIVSIQPENWDRNKAYEITTNLIQAHPNLKGIFAANDVMALAAAEALETAEKRDGVIIYGIDFTDEAQEAIIAGRLDGSITYSPAVYTKAALLLSSKIIQGHEVTEPVYCPLAIVNKDNINEYDGWE